MLLSVAFLSTVIRLCRTDVVDDFLGIVEKYNSDPSNCDSEAATKLPDGVVKQYGLNQFRTQANIAVQRANLLTQIWTSKDSAIRRSPELFWMIVKNMVMADPYIFAAGNCYDLNQFDGEKVFCPYVYRGKGDEIVGKNLAASYDYVNDSQADWFHNAREIAEAKLRSFAEQGERQAPNGQLMLVTYVDGHWSKPYFDCGGGDIWMMTYTIPFFGIHNGKLSFKGTSGIDIDLRLVDIDQCPSPTNTTKENIFADSDKCTNSTACAHIPDQGFRRGSYVCHCRKGFYFPRPSAALKYFNGTDVEYEYEKLHNDNKSYLGSAYPHGFACLECAPGCDECVDYSPCLFEENWALRGTLLATSILISSVIIISCFIMTVLFRNSKVIKAASPVLLRVIITGALLEYATVFAMYVPAEKWSCTTLVWARELGFFLFYGALLLKTWRISVVFRVKSAKRVKISDVALIQRLLVIVAICIGFLTARTIVDLPRPIMSVTSSGLKAQLCSRNWWNHTATIAEFIFLLWGIFLLWRVRRAPSQFNESKFISFSIYNETILTLFLNIALAVLQHSPNPDIEFCLIFAHTHVTISISLIILFGSKLYMQKRLSLEAEKAGPNRHPANTTTIRNKSRKSDEEELPPLHKDVEEEIRRLYRQLEAMRRANMVLRNPHVSNDSTRTADGNDDEVWKDSPVFLTRLLSSDQEDADLTSSV